MSFLLQITSITAFGALKKELEVQQGDLYDKLQMLKTEVAEERIRLAFH